jgi:hypothetical protein
MEPSQQYPRVLYRGSWTRDAGAGVLETVTVGSLKEEKAKLADGFVVAEDIETLVNDPTAVPAGKKSKAKPAEDGE